MVFSVWVSGTLSPFLGPVSTPCLSWPHPGGPSRFCLHQLEGNGKTANVPDVPAFSNSLSSSPPALWMLEMWKELPQVEQPSSD
jgi:hypothetical protein